MENVDQDASGENPDQDPLKKSRSGLPTLIVE